VVILASPKMLAHSAKARLVVMIRLMGWSPLPETAWKCQSGAYDVPQNQERRP
jgi:hypothetical protein